MNKPIDLSSHPILQQAFDVIQAIEKCGASVELTNAVTKAGELMTAINELIAIRELKGDKVPVAEIRLIPSNTGRKPCIYWFGKQDMYFPVGTQFFTTPKKLTDLPYDVLFNAIAKSATPLGEHMSISVKDFKAAIEDAGCIVKDGD